MADHFAKPTVVLVHGAWMDGFSWREVALPVEALGFTVVAAQLPLTSLSDDVAAAGRLLRRQMGSKLLVGHSYGGSVVTAAAAADPAVKGLVCIAAIVPDQAETVGEIFGREPRDPQAPELRADESGLRWVTGDAFRIAISPEAPAGDLAMLAAAQKPISIQCLREPLKEGGWRNRPSWFLVAKNDLMLSPPTQRFTADRMGAKILSLPVDHSPMLSQPKMVVDLIAEAAHAVEFGGPLAAGDGTTQAIATTPTGRLQ